MKEEYVKYYHPKFPVAARMIKILYDLNGCACGGCCHIVTDDNNIRNSDLESVIKYCNETKDAIDSELSRTICEIMLQMTIEQRMILFYTIEEGYNYFVLFDEDEFECWFDSVQPEEILQKCIEEKRYNIE